MRRLIPVALFLGLLPRAPSALAEPSPAEGLSPPPLAAPAGAGSGAAAEPGTDRALAPESDPVRLTRTLQLLQDRIAQGSVPAHLSQVALLAEVEKAMLAAGRDTWSDRGEVVAAVTFALSGGGPRILKRIDADRTFAGPEVSLLRGALAFLEGREVEARALIGAIDASRLPPSLAGTIAMTQSALAAGEDVPRAIARLDQARLLAPGTLVEEGALRREVVVVGQSGDLARFEALTTQYLRRFPHSVYAGNFRRSVADVLERVDFDGTRDGLDLLDRLLAEFAPASRRDLYLLVAGTAIRKGRTAVGLHAAGRAGALSAPATASAARAELYKGAAEILALPTIESGLSRLASVDRGILPPADVQLLDDARSMAAQIRRIPTAPAVGTAAAPAAKPGEAPPGIEKNSRMLMTRARSLIGSADALVGETRR